MNMSPRATVFLVGTAIPAGAGAGVGAGTRCVHRWLLMGGDPVHARCRRCGARRTFTGGLYERRYGGRPARWGAWHGGREERSAERRVRADLQAAQSNAEFEMRENR